MVKIIAKNILLDSGWAQNFQVEIGQDGRIASVGPASVELASVGSVSDNERQVVDLLLPAPVNLHSHSFQRAMAGLTEARGNDAKDSFWTWRNLIYQYLQYLTPEDVEAVAAQVFMETLEAGYSSIVEFHYLHHAIGGQPYDRMAELSERIIAAAEYTGIGLTLLPVFYQYGGCDLRPLQGGQLRFKTDLDQYETLFRQADASIQRAAADYNIGIAPHSLRAASPSDLDALTKLAGDRPFHIHVAEQVAEVEDVQGVLGARPIEWLLDNADLDERWCLIHCTQMNSEETIGLAKSGAIVGLCPLTESSLGDGIFNGVDFLAEGGSFGIGSDSNIRISLFDELQTLEYSQRLRDRGRAVLATPEKSTGRNIYDLALQGGAAASQRATGCIKVGNFADLIGFYTNNEWLAGRQNDEFLDTLIFGGCGLRCLTDVWSAGRHVVQDCVHRKNEVIKRNFINVLEKLGQSL